MGEMYLTFKGTTTGIVDAFYPTQAMADAGATDDDITAVQGVKTVPDNFRPNKAYFDGTNVLGEIPELVIYNALSEVEKLKVGFHNFHNGLKRASTFLEMPDIKSYYPDDDRKIAHDMLALTHRMCRGVGLSTDYTSQQKFAWLIQMAKGPTNVSFLNGPEAAAAAFFEIVEEARLDDSVTDIVSPTVYYGWAHPGTAVGWTIEQGLSMLDDTLIATFAAAATDFTIFRNGDWINDITV